MNNTNSMNPQETTNSSSITASGKGRPRKYQTEAEREEARKLYNERRRQKRAEEKAKKQQEAQQVPALPPEKADDRKGTTSTSSLIDMELLDGSAHITKKYKNTIKTELIKYIRENADDYDLLSGLVEFIKSYELDEEDESEDDTEEEDDDVTEGK